MDQIGNYVLYVIMFCAVLGAFAAIRDSEKGLGREFMEGIHATGHIFVPAAGIMASIPYLTVLIESVFGPFFDALNADPALAATMIIASDMGGYHLAAALTESKEALIMALITGFMGGATIVFSIPMGLAMLDKRDHKYMALGIMSGILSIPVGVLIASVVLMLSNPAVREVVATNGEATYQLAMSLGGIFANLLPIIVFVVALAAGLRFLPDLMIKGFIAFGRGLDAMIKLVLVFSIVEYFTGFFTVIFGGWGFHPIIADAEDQTRALETAGYIGIMLAGAFPMVYLLRKYLGGPLEALGGRVGLSAVGSAGMLATIANILAMFRLVRFMPPKDKVINIAFGVCAAFLLGDHLSFTANFQPTIILPVLIGKILAGFTAVGLAYWLSVPKALQLEQQDRAAGIIDADEYPGSSLHDGSLPIPKAAAHA
ncbi:ethanolamine utilization protein EutH [Stutzerimonas stutzeri]|jgi:ethanolamine transporter|uniref:Ethanolamine utilization protein EutH n=1 Tax=Stutzerimonas stutzeri TaxID=316 RepID=A0A023WSK4_STUST|nr:MULTISPECIES: ethanolamine utilization protein EutH [Stutzerimonas]KKJ95800.1 ethanolamine utilization protein EutH [Stutzerimonas stutzeri]MAF88288.1 ethanolamine utilization protein EutH [Pseudomonas sp.]AHY42799.1 ethanolamine utilization protein EutH [Stutzerimonas decontaminans]MAK87648.1 ethanolamine utilization protein EutH [Pseudomonas sp.]MBD3875809.1 ethanolamine utilization protein EutH [Stutzerimonas kunmingensis]|tara:strand:+ start:592 stop:1875 length:1284 start_codon:yes stop_codon:yes gene_type:complete